MLAKADFVGQWLDRQKALKAFKSVTHNNL
jgi:hypothetical protein